MVHHSKLAKGTPEHSKEVNTHGQSQETPTCAFITESTPISGSTLLTRSIFVLSGLSFIFIFIFAPPHSPLLPQGSSLGPLQPLWNGMGKEIGLGVFYIPMTLISNSLDDISKWFHVDIMKGKMETVGHH